MEKWPDLLPFGKCWLQIRRAKVQEDFAKHPAFSFGPRLGNVAYGLQSTADWLLSLLDELGQKGYDLSVCDSIVHNQ